MIQLTPSSVPTTPIAKTFDQEAHIRAELGWLALLETLVGKDRAREFIRQAVSQDVGTSKA